MNDTRKRDREQRVKELRTFAEEAGTDHLIRHLARIISPSLISPD
jgi:hypothetical protein